MAPSLLNLASGTLASGANAGEKFLSAPHETQLQAVKRELALAEETGRDLCKQLLWGKDSLLQAKCKNSEWQQAHAELQREHLELQQKHSNYVFNTTAAEATQQTIDELQAKLIEMQEELSTVQLDRNQYWEKYRQQLIINSKLMQEMDSLKAQLAAVQDSHATTAAQQPMKSPLWSPFGSPISQVNTSLLSSSNVQVKRATSAGFGRSPLSNISSTQEMNLLKAQLAAVQDPHAMTAAQQPMKSPLGSPFSSPITRVNSALPSSSNVQVKQATFAGFVRSPLSNISNTQGMDSLKAQLAAVQDPHAMTAAQQPVKSPLWSPFSSPIARANSALLNSSSVQVKRVTSAGFGRSPLSNISNTQGIGKLEAIWAPSPSVDSQTYKEMFGVGSSDSTDGEDDAPLLTPRSSRLLLKASSGPISSGKDSQTSFESFRPSVDDSDASAPLDSTAVTKGGSRHSSNGGDSPYSSEPWPLTGGMPPSNPALLASSALLSLRWRYRHGSCSSLSTMDSDESSPEASQRLQSAQLPSPPSANPKPLSRQEVQEERWGCGRSSCSDDDTDIDVSAVFGGTIGSGATRNPAVTAMLSSSTASQLGSLQPGSAFSVGELDVAAFRLSFDFSSPVSLASVKLQCPVPGSGISPPWKLSPASPEAGSHTSSGTATIAGSAPLPSAEPMLTVTQQNTTDSRLSVTPADRSSNSSASVSSLSTGSALRGIRSPATAASMAKSSGSAGDRRHSRGSIGSSATGRPSLSGSQSRRPSWSIARPTSPAVTAVQLPPTLAKAAPLTRTSTPPACQPAFQRASTGAAAAAAAKSGTRVPELAAGVMTRRQAAAAAAAAAHNGAKLASDVGAVPTRRPRQARSLKPEAPTRRQPQRAARPQWR